MIHRPQNGYTQVLSHTVHTYILQFIDESSTEQGAQRMQCACAYIQLFCMHAAENEPPILFYINGRQLVSLHIQYNSTAKLHVGAICHLLKTLSFSCFSHPSGITNPISKQSSF